MKSEVSVSNEVFLTSFCIIIIITIVVVVVAIVVMMMMTISNTRGNNTSLRNAYINAINKDITTTTITTSINSRSDRDVIQ